MRLPLAVAPALFAALLTACMPPPLRCAPGYEPTTRFELYLGRERADGTEVSDETWQAFLEEEAVPRFPEGLSILDAVGRYRGEGGRIYRERSFVIVVFASSEDARARLEGIADEYVVRFAQESALVTEGATCVSLR